MRYRDNNIEVAKKVHNGQNTEYERIVCNGYNGHTKHYLSLILRRPKMYRSDCSKLETCKGGVSVETGMGWFTECDGIYYRCPSCNKEHYYLKWAISCCR